MTTIVVSATTGDGRTAGSGDSIEALSAGIGYGRHGFALSVPGGLAPERTHRIQVLRAADGAELPNSPWLVRPVPPHGS